MPKFFISRYRFRRGTATFATTRRFLRLSPTMLCIIVFAGLCALYVWQLTTLSMQSYVRNRLLRDHAALESEREYAAASLVEYQSLARVEARLPELNFIRDTNVDYITRDELRRVLSQR